LYILIMVAIGLVYYIYMLATRRSLAMPAADSGADQPSGSGAAPAGGA
jgi:hypothetical protein